MTSRLGTGKSVTFFTVYPSPCLLWFYALFSSSCPVSMSCLRILFPLSMFGLSQIMYIAGDACIRVFYIIIAASTMQHHKKAKIVEEGLKECHAHCLFVGIGPSSSEKTVRFIVNLHYPSLTRSSLSVAGRGLPFLADGIGGKGQNLDEEALSLVFLQSSHG